MSPRTSAQFDEIRQRSRQRIMDAALELFGTYGYQGTSISKIAQAAGVSKGLMYNYFSSKQDLLQAIVISEAEEGAKWAHEIFEQDISAYEKIRQMTLRAIAEVKKDMHHWRLLTSLAFQPDVMEGIEALVATYKEPMMRGVITLFAELGITEPEKEAFFYGALLDGIFLHYLSAGDQYPLTQVVEYTLQKYKPVAPTQQE